mgnify:CR=1 FL=1
MHTNTVELIGHYGSDLTHACSAWTSTSRELTEDKLGRVGPLLKMLAENGHHTPFEKSSLHFLCTTDIATHIHLLKHRIGVSANSESGRYRELKDKFYVPQDWDEQEQKKHIEFCEMCLREYHECLARLVAKGMTRSRAKESARFKLPYSNQYTVDVMFNFRSFEHFLKLRFSLHSQTEVRELAGRMLKLVKDTGSFNLTLMAFGYMDSKGVLVEP